MLCLVCYQDHDKLLASFRQAIRSAGKRLKLVVLDHIISFPPVVLPVKELCELCR